MGENADTVKRGYEAWRNGDRDAMAEFTADDFTVEGTQAEGLPVSGNHEGRDAALEVLQNLAGAWDSFSFNPDEFFEQGDTVVVLAHSDVEKDDRSATIPVVHIWRVEEGKAKRLQVLPDTLLAARTLGVV